MNIETTAEPNVEQAVPFFWVHDITKSILFYVDGLGFHMTRHWLDDGRLRWCWLRLGGAGLMLQEFWKEGHHRNVPEGRLGVGVSIYFVSKDALMIYRDFTSRGVQAKQPFVGNGMWVTRVSDPDGYDLFFESPTDAPEETEFTDATL